jgi:hypothetical protein
MNSQLRFEDQDLDSFPPSRCETWSWKLEYSYNSSCYDTIKTKQLHQCDSSVSHPPHFGLIFIFAHSYYITISDQPAGVVTVVSGEGGWFSHVMYMVTSIS